MRWYTNNDGLLCLGTQNSRFSGFLAATSLRLEQQVDQPLTDEQVEQIGSFPEDWQHDPLIDKKIEQVAAKLFADTAH